MKKYFLLSILIYSASAPANVIRAERSESLTNPGIKHICSYVTSEHLNDIQHVDDLYQKLKEITLQKDLLDKSKIIHEIVFQINEYSKRIRYLARPEWSSERIPIELTWVVNHDLFYNESTFLNLKKAILFRREDQGIPYVFNRNLVAGDFVSPLNSFIAGLKNKAIDPDLGKYLIMTNTRSSILEKKLLKSYFMNTENEDVKNYLALNPRLLRTESEIDHNFVIKYQKNATTLEICQMINTLLFEVEVSYAVYEPDPSDNTKKVKVIKKDMLYLTARNEAAHVL